MPIKHAFVNPHADGPDTTLTRPSDWNANHAGSLPQSQSHDSPDTDSSPTALHHTLGTGANQALAGNTQLAQTIANVLHRWLNSYNATTGLFTQTQPDYSDLTGTPAIPAAILIDTRANILAASAATVRVAFATDTLRVYLADGTNWNETPIEWATRTSTPDMGFTQNSSRAGYGQDYVTDKNLANVAIGSNANVANASATLLPIRASGGTLQIYVSGAWQTVVSNFVFKEDSLWGWALEHKPIGFTTWIEVMSGSSLNDLGLNGLPTVNHYIVDMGSFPAPSLVGGRAIG